MQKPENRPLIALGLGMLVVLASVCWVAWQLSPTAGKGLLALFVVGVVIVIIACWWWMRWFAGKMQRIENQLHAARSDQADYQITINDEGAFSGLHNELFHYVRQNLAEREALAQDRDRLSMAITDIAHQLRTPIAVMGNLSELLTPANAKASALELHAQNRRLEVLVEQLILLARVDTHTLSQTRTNVALDDLLKASLAPLLAMLTASDIGLDWQVPAISVNVNRNLTQEALVNLFKNALEHAPAHSTLAVSATATPISTIVVLQHAGKPIPQAELSHLFERFYRGADSAPNSLGVGLAIAKGIIEAGSGRLTISNVPVGVQTRIEWFH